MLKRTVAFLCVLALMLTLPVFAAAAAAPGDVDGNGGIAAADARLCLRRAVGLEDYAAGSAEFAACDVTRDGDVSAADARFILRAAVGLLSLDLAETDPENNAYNTIRSSDFYAKGAMLTEGETMPMEFGSAPDNTIYMLTATEGVEIAVFRDSSDDMYLLLPSKKIYLKLNKTIMGVLGVEAEDLIDLDGMGFGDLPPLSDADSVTFGEFNGSACMIYTFEDPQTVSSLAVYMNGNRLLGIEELSGWDRSVITFDSVTAGLPAEKASLPKDYRKANILTFMAEAQNLFG